jgi:hypothetical protein
VFQQLPNCSTRQMKGVFPNILPSSDLFFFGNILPSSDLVFCCYFHQFLLTFFIWCRMTLLLGDTDQARPACCLCWLKGLIKTTLYKLNRLALYFLMQSVQICVFSHSQFISILFTLKFYTNCAARLCVHVYIRTICTLGQSDLQGPRDIHV